LLLLPCSVGTAADVSAVFLEVAGDYVAVGVPATVLFTSSASGVLGVTGARHAADVPHNDDGRPFLVGKIHIY
jgi:hypothetical protein